MNKTTHYQLNKPEITDPMRLADFNENADIIDAALANLNTALGGKAEKSAVTAVETALANYKTTNDAAVASLQSAVNGKGNCRIAFGSYTGTGTCGEINPTVLSPGFCPVFAAVGSDNSVEQDCNPSLLIRGKRYSKAEYRSSSTADKILYLTWGDTSVSWYNPDNPEYQNNMSGTVYYYVVVGY